MTHKSAQTGKPTAEVFSRLGVLLLIGGMAFTFAAHGDAPPPWRQTVNVVYDEVEGVALVMDVFVPITSGGPGAGRGVVCIVSGAWKSDRGMVEAHRTFGFFDVLCAHGYTVFAVRPGTYTLFTAEEMLNHIHSAIRFIKVRAREYAVDPSRLALVGASAGGHLACLAATRAQPAEAGDGESTMRPDTMVGAVGVFCPPTDFLDWDGERYGFNLMEGRLVFRDGLSGHTAEEIETAAKAISPVYHVTPGLPPFLLIHGDADSLVPFQQSLKLKARLEESGVPVELLVKEGGDHSWPTVREEVEKLAQWLDAHIGGTL